MAYYYPVTQQSQYVPQDPYSYSGSQWPSHYVPQSQSYPPPPPPPTYNPLVGLGRPRDQQARYYDAHQRVPVAIGDSTAAQVPTIPSVAQVQTLSPVPSLVQVPSVAQEPTVAQVPIAQEDQDNDSEMWNLYMDEVNEEDSRITDAWKEDAGSIVVFTGLFSAIVGAFIIEFYKRLSPDSGSQSVALLQQISQQLPNSPNSANSNTTNLLLPPGTAMVWVWINIFWLMSLVLSLTCALIATLLQQWARTYIQMPKSADVPRHRARVRSLLLSGARSYKISLIVEILPTLLHLSVFLFFGGLVMTFHTIHKRVAIAVDVAVGVSGLAYIVISILPCLDVSCPYRTPISRMLWYPCHAFLSFAALCLQGFLSLVLSRGQRLHWLASHKFTASAHRQYFKDGLEKSIVYRAVQMLEDGDYRRVTWLFIQLALGDRSKFLKFAASIPIERIPDLILSTTLKSLPLASLAVLRSCVTNAYYQVDEDIRERAHLVCLHAIYHIAKAPTLPNLDFMRDHLANAQDMRSRGFARTASGSILALVARKVVRKRRLGEADLRWLQEVIRKPRDAILEASVAMRDQMNFEAFVIRVLPYQLGNNIPTEDAALINETLAILLKERANNQNYSATDLQNQIYEEIERIHRHDPEDGRNVFDRLHVLFPSLVAPFPSSAEARYPNSSQVAPPAITGGGYYVPSPPPSVVYYVSPTPPQPTVVHVGPTPGPPPPVVLSTRPPYNFPPPLPASAAPPTPPPAPAPISATASAPAATPTSAPATAPSAPPTSAPATAPSAPPTSAPSTAPSAPPTPPPVAPSAAPL